MMAGMEPHFPVGIRQLSIYKGRFGAKKLSAAGCEVLYASYPAGKKIEPHSHQTENHGVVTCGELILETKGEERSLKTGEWHYIGSERVHSARCEVDTHVLEFWFRSAGS